jgi:hypothetical protein
MITPKLGKKAARPGAVKLKLKDYVDIAGALPEVPNIFGHEDLIPARGWGMLGNDTYGDCVWAGAAHEHMLWNKAAGRDITFDDTHVLKDYSKVTGFNPDDPDTDQGTDMEVAAKYRRKTGIGDSGGKRHKVIAYLDITPGDLAEHLVAAYLFGAVGIGIEFPGSAMDQFNNDKPWDVVPRSSIEGGHYIPFVARRGAKDLVVLTWGQKQLMTPRFLSKYNDESVVYLTRELFNEKGMSPEGFNLEQLKVDLNNVVGQPVSVA